MKITIEAESKEIADLVASIQNRQVELKSSSKKSPFFAELNRAISEACRLAKEERQPALLENSQNQEQAQRMTKKEK